jgi:hypothetical protein
MKKATSLLIAFFALLAIGCSSDDDNALAGVDPILGKWSLMTQYENEVPKELGDCQKDNFHEFKEEGTLTLKANVFASDVCTEVSKSGNWKREFTGKYILSGADFPDVIDPETKKVKKPIIYAKFTYESTQMIIVDTLNKVVYKRVYKKM